MPRVMTAIRRFARTKDSGELFLEAQRRHIAFGEVQTVAQVAANPQYEFRGTFRRRRGVRRRPDAGAVRPLPRPRPSPEQQPPPDAPPCSTTSSPTGAGCRPPRPTPADRAPRRTVAGGQAARRPARRRLHVGARRPVRHPHPRRPRRRHPQVPDGGAGDARQLARLPVLLRVEPVEAARLPRHEAAGGARPSSAAIIEQSDVLMENFSAGVLDRWGIGYEQVREWNPEIVYVTMSGPGHDGPWSKMITYAPTIHALCGLTYLSNPPDRRTSVPASRSTTTPPGCSRRSPCCPASRPAAGRARASTSTSPRWRPAPTSSARRCSTTSPTVARPTPSATPIPSPSGPRTRCTAAAISTRSPSRVAMTMTGSGCATRSPGTSPTSRASPSCRRWRDGSPGPPRSTPGCAGGAPAARPRRRRRRCRPTACRPAPSRTAAS